MTKYLSVKNWDEFQHYKKTRNPPPWIKLHRELLRDYDFLQLLDDDKLHLMLIWLLASQLNNKIPNDENFIRAQIGVKNQINLEKLIELGFLVDASTLLASCKQSAMLETETEEETDKETETETEPQVSTFNISNYINNSLRITLIGEAGELDFNGYLIPRYNKVILKSGNIPDNPVGSFRNFIRKCRNDYEQGVT